MTKGLMAAIIAASAIVAMPIGAIGGVLAERHYDNETERDAWEGVLVVRNGTLVANPAALTPQELADSQIMSRSPRLVGFGCQGAGGAAMVAWEEDEFPTCREVMTLAEARRRAR